MEANRSRPLSETYPNRSYHNAVHVPTNYYSGTSIHCFHTCHFATRLIHFYWTWKMDYIHNVQWSQMHHSSKYHFHVTCSDFLVMNHNIPKMTVCKRKQKKYDFFKWTVVVNLPILANPANMQNVAMCWPSANDKWVMGWLGHLAVRWQAYQLLLNCPNHTLTIVLSHSHQKPNSKYPFNFICVFCKRMKAQSH